jgi:hypothetical protein
MEASMPRKTRATVVAASRMKPIPHDQEIRPMNDVSEDALAEAESGRAFARNQTAYGMKARRMSRTLP